MYGQAMLKNVFSLGERALPDLLLVSLSLFLYRSVILCVSMENFVVDACLTIISFISNFDTKGKKLLAFCNTF